MLLFVLKVFKVVKAATFSSIFPQITLGGYFVQEIVWVIYVKIADKMLHDNDFSVRKSRIFQLIYIFRKIAVCRVVLSSTFCSFYQLTTQGLAFIQYPSLNNYTSILLCGSHLQNINFL